MKNNLSVLQYELAIVLMLTMASVLNAQVQRQPTPDDTLASFTILPENKVRFSIYAPNADQVVFSSSDMPRSGLAGS